MTNKQLAERIVDTVRERAEQAYEEWVIEEFRHRVRRLKLSRSQREVLAKEVAELSGLDVEELL